MGSKLILQKPNDFWKEQVQGKTVVPQWQNAGGRARNIYFGVLLANDHNSHAKSRTQAMRKAFYALQVSGLCQHGSNLATISHIFKAVVQPVLTYGMECIFQSKSALHLAQSAQTKLLKASLGLKTSCKSPPCYKL